MSKPEDQVASGSSVIQAFEQARERMFKLGVDTSCSAGYALLPMKDGTRKRFQVFVELIEWQPKEEEAATKGKAKK